MKNKLLLLAMGIALSAQTLMAQVPSYVPSNGLVGYWPFSGNANDESGIGNNGTVNGATLTTDRNGNANSAYSFNGTSDFINIANSPSLSPTTSISLCGWIKSRSTIPFDRIINKSHNIAQNYSTYQLITRNVSLNATPGFTLRFGTGNSQLSNDYLYSGDNIGNVYFDNWQFIVGTWDGTTMKFYQNGILISSTARTGLLNYTNGDLQFGKGNVGTVQPQFYKGEIDDIAIYNRALSQTEITSMYNGISYSDTCHAVSGSLTQGLVGYWPFCGNANDDSGNGNNGTVNGATLTTDRFGNANTAYSFDGLNSRITTNYYGILGQNSRTISLWFKINNSTSNGELFNYGSGFGGGINMYLAGNNNPTIDTSSSQIIYNPSVNTNTWHNYVMTYSSADGTNILACKIYIDGVLLTSINSQFNPNQLLNSVSGNPVQFGGASIPFYGDIDDIGIWNRALTTQEITQLYNQNQCFTNTTVTDTLIINVGQLSYNNPVTYANNITMAPNPASTQININFNNITDLNGGTLKIINSLGQEVATTPITTSGTQSIMQLATWGGSGMYYVQIINPQGIVVDVKKIILQ